jgi:hypothetical protein
MFTGVSPDVALEEPRSGEALSTEMAFAALVVGTEVHGVGRHGDVGLAAVRALPRLLVLQRPERLKISSQANSHF